MTVKTNRAVNEVVHWTVADLGPGREGGLEVKQAVFWAVGRAVYWAVNRAVYWAVYDAVGEDRPHPGLQDFLLEAGGLKSDD